MAIDNFAPSVDLAARQCVMASMLYYALDVNVMSDHDYDRLSLLVSTHHKLLTPLRQWMVGKAEEIRSSGFQCRVTMLAADAALNWIASKGMSLRDGVQITRPWRNDKRQGLRFLHTNEFRWRDI